MAAKPEPRPTRSLRVEDDLWERVVAAAGEEGSTPSDLVREALKAYLSGRTGGVDASEDREYAEALDRLVTRYGKRRPADAIRMAVVTFRGLVDEFRADPVQALDDLRRGLPGGPLKRKG